MDRKRVLVCGATGFIGRNIVERFANRSDMEVVGVYNRQPPFEWPGVRWEHADLTNAEDVNRVVSGKDIIVQAAATTSGAKDIVTRPYIHITDNAVMNSLLLRAAFDTGISHFVFFSCTVMYHASEQPLKETEFDPNKELHPRYFGIGSTKLYIEQMCEFYSRISDIRFTVARHSNVYGPHDKFDLDRSHVFGATVTKAMTADNGRITVWGSGEEGRDLIYISDLVEFVERAIDRQTDNYELLNVAAGKAITVRELVTQIIAGSGRDLTIEHDLSEPTIPTTYCFDSARALETLGWSPAVSLKDGIRKTIDWWRENEAQNH